jgi:hypothetical protein
MLLRLTPFLRPVLGLFAILFAVSLAGFSHGQDDLPGNREEEIEKVFTKNRSVFMKMLRGDDPYDANNKAQQEILDSGAKYVTYRFTWVTIEKDRGKVDEVHRDYEAQLQAIVRNKTNQQDIANAYTKAVIVRAREVIALRSINTRKPDLARINAARVLAKLAELGQGELADALIDVFNQELARDADPTGPKRNDGVVYYVLHGMRDLLALPVPAQPGKPVLTPEREKKLAETLQAFTAKAPPFSKDTPAEEIEGYRAMRREAVHGLAYCRAPGMKDKERPAMTLLRIMARDGFLPEPRIDETAEAAIGLARLRPVPELDGTDYQPEYAAYQLAQYADYFVKYYLNNLSDPNDKKKFVEMRPYRIYASRMLEALEAMKADIKNEYVAKAIDECRKVLAPVEKGDVTKTLDLEDWLKTNPPPVQGLFKGVADSTAKPANHS